MSKEILELIRKQETKGRVVYIPLDGQLVSADLDAFVSQPTDGLLWDLNRDKLTASAWIREGKTIWVNNYAVALVITKLKATIEELKAGK